MHKAVTLEKKRNDQEKDNYTKTHNTCAPILDELRKHKWMCNLWWKNYVTNKMRWMTKIYISTECGLCLCTSNHCAWFSLIPISKGKCKLFSAAASLKSSYCRKIQQQQQQIRIIKQFSGLHLYDDFILDLDFRL